MAFFSVGEGFLVLGLSQIIVGKPRLDPGEMGVVGYAFEPIIYG
jgi:hypothetical protein